MNICTKQHPGRVRKAVKDIDQFSQAEENGRHRCAACAFEEGAKRMTEAVRNELAKFVEEKFGGRSLEGDIVFAGASHRLDALLSSLIKAQVTMIPTHLTEGGSNRTS